jgi:hypothetical protein
VEEMLYTSVCLEGLSKTTKRLSRSNQFPNKEPPEQEAAAMLATYQVPLISVTFIS